MKKLLLLLLFLVCLSAQAATTNLVDNIKVKYSLDASNTTFSGTLSYTNLGFATNAPVFWITNTVVKNVVTNGNGSITVTTTNLVYLGLRP